MTDEGLRIVSAASVSLEEYAAAFTSAFRDYRFAIAFDAGMLARRVRFEQHDLENSLLAYEGGEAVGVAGLAARGDRGWVAGLAVVPRLRGRGLGRELMSALLARARASGLRRLSLEVLADNDGARRLYERAGMRVTRGLVILERPAGAGAAETAGDAPRKAPAGELLAHFARLHREPPAWQRDLPSLLAANLRGLYVGGRRRPGAYALIGQSRDGNRYVSDLAAADDERAEEMCAALGHMPDALKIINEPERSPFVAPLLRHGFAEVARQHEMSVEL